MRLTSGALCVSIAMAGYPIAAQAQSAGKVIERHIEAIGGRKAVEKIVSTDVSGTIRSGDGPSGVFIQRTSRPDRYFMSMSWADSRWRAGFNGRSAWQEDGVEGLRTLYGQSVSRVRAEATYANTRLLDSDTLNQVSVVRRDQLRGRPVIVVVAVSPDAMTRTLFFDASSYLLVKDEQQTDAGLEERFFDDYRPVDQVMEPHRVEWHRNGETFLIAVERVTHNVPLGEQAFDVPAVPAERPLDIDALLSAVIRSEQRAGPLRAGYAYTMTSSSGKVDEQGRATLSQGASYETFHIGGQPVSKLVRKRGGEALSEAERRREDERVNKIVREYEQQRLSEKAVPRRQGEAPQGSLVILIPLLDAHVLPAYLRMSAFRNIRRERVRDRPALVVEFEPRPGVVPNSDFERQTGATAGTLWIDEASEHVIRMESFFRDDYGRTARGSSLRIERTLVNDEVWLPSRAELAHRWTFFFGARSQWLATTQYTDHKKFTVATDSAITLPDAHPDRDQPPC